jgi:HAD superfamily hydrolase (TIGR01484 family)
MNKKLVFADVDGTMVRHGAEGPTEAAPRVAEAIGRLLYDGHTLVPVTSRTPRMMGDLAAQVGLKHLGVLDGGATIYDFAENAVDLTRSQWLTAYTTRQVMESVRPYADATYYGQDSRQDDGHTTIDEASPSVFAVYPNQHSDSVKEALVSIDGITPRTNAYESTGTHSCVQVTAAGISKQHGVRTVLADPRYRGYEPQDIMAIGDGDPDVDLLLAVPDGAQRVMVGDNPVLRPYVTAAVAPADQDGFADALERLVL